MSRQKRLAVYTKAKPDQTYFLTSPTADVEEPDNDGIDTIWHLLDKEQIAVDNAEHLTHRQNRQVGLPIMIDKPYSGPFCTVVGLDDVKQEKIARKRSMTRVDTPTPAGIMSSPRLVHKCIEGNDLPIWSTRILMRCHVCQHRVHGWYLS
jgi:hypothetical protein